MTLDSKDLKFLEDNAMHDIVPCPTCKKGHIRVFMTNKLPNGLNEYILLNGQTVREKIVNNKLILER